jgi:cbb3-type cytochrome oxidase subunit 3
MDWFNLAMSVRPYFMVWVVLLLAGILYVSLRPQRSKDLDAARLIPLGDDDPSH